MLFISQCLSGDRVQLKERPLVYSLYLFQFGCAKRNNNVYANHSRS